MTWNGVERRRYARDSSSGGGDWGDYRRLVVFQLRSIADTIDSFEVRMRQVEQKIYMAAGGLAVVDLLLHLFVKVR